ncbi:MAG: LysE family translocator [Synergistaceae bacterium]|jgi:threonine/homoserine/homoserine lactone efflux protein|nr:LysE family translocator [Synergistaceae bacterium]
MISRWDEISKFLEGLRFGLLLQFAVGPVCLMVFNTAGVLGFSSGALAALAVTLIDGLYIFLAALGVAAFLQGEKAAKIVRCVGACVLAAFGADIASSALGIPLFPQFSLLGGVRTDGVFLKAVLLTASNPLTIIFWGGVFSANVTGRDLNGRRLLCFGAGCAAATFIFLNAVVLAGSVVKTFLPREVMVFLNVCIGIILIFFALKMSGMTNYPRKRGA